MNQSLRERIEGLRPVVSWGPANDEHDLIDKADILRIIAEHERALAAVAMNLLRIVGQHTLHESDSPMRKVALRRRIKTVLQEVMYRAAKFVEHARRLLLEFGRGVAAHVKVFVTVQARLCAVASP